MLTETTDKKDMELAENLLCALEIFPKRLLNLDAIQRTNGIPASHIQLLALLHMGPMAVGEISKEMGVAKPNITPLLDNLCNQGLVERIRDTEDHRVVRASLTEKGEQYVDELRLMMGRMVKFWKGQLSENEYQEMAAAVDCLVQACAKLRKLEIL